MDHTPGKHLVPPPDPPPPAPAPLVEGVDFYVERGQWVFTAAYLLRRGHCCESGCRHCPYRGVGDETGERPSS